MIEFYYRRKMIILQDYSFNPYLKPIRSHSIMIKRQWYTGNMHVNSPSGYREIAHTADWELEVWAPNLPGLLKQAAIGMYQLAGAQIAADPRSVRQFFLQLIEPEMLLIEFLNELLFLIESEGVIFDQFDLRLKDGQMHARLTGAPILSIDKEIKAATYHKLDIVEMDHGLSARIVFDV
jgi:SHS2 domain-containing protein